MAQYADILIIGAGSSGAAAAWFLAESGAGRVLVLDKKGPGSGATGHAAGLIRHQYADRTIVEMVRYCSERFKRFEEEVGFSVDYVNNGYLLLTGENDEGIGETVAMQRSAGARMDLLSPEQVQHIHPKGEINVEGVGHGVFDKDGAYADPYKVAAGYLGAARQKGVTAKIGETVLSLETEGNRVTKVVTDRDTYCADIVINAAGLGAAAINASLGIAVPLKNFSLNHAVFIPDSPFEPDVMTVNDESVGDALSFCRPESGGTCLIGMDQDDPERDFDPAAYYMDVPFKKMGAFYKKLTQRLPFLGEFRVSSAFGGLDVRTPDWNPGLGFMEGAPENYYQVIGGSGHAFKLAPAIGRTVSEDILGKERSLDMSAFDIDRLRDFRDDSFAGSFSVNE